MADDLARRRAVAEEAALAVGVIQRRYMGTNVGFEVKSDPLDFLTRADIESHAAIKSIIGRAFPGEPIIGEEDGLSRDAIAAQLGGCWLVDPLDSTHSYVHDFPIFGPGIAWVEDGQPLVGVIHTPVWEELFSAARGSGATLNGNPIRVTQPKPLKQALVGIHIREASDEAVTAFLETTRRVLLGSHGIRLLGGPMFGVAYVAAGRLDAFATLSPSKLGPYDIAPAVAVIEAAGGVAGDGAGGPWDLLAMGLSGASNQALLDELFAVALADS